MLLDFAVFISDIHVDVHSCSLVHAHTHTHTQLSGYEGSGYEESLDNGTGTYPTSEEDVGNNEDDDGMDGDESGRVQCYSRTMQCAVVELYFVCELVDTLPCSVSFKCTFIYM